MTFKFKENRSQNQKARDSLSRMPRLIKKALRKGMYISGEELTKDARDNMTNSPKSGRTYRVYRGIGGRKLVKPRSHTASARGEYPAVITGALRKSVDFRVRGMSRLDFGAGDTERELAEEYAAPLEKSRKYLKQTIDRLQNNVMTNVNKELNKALNSLGANIKRK